MKRKLEMVFSKIVLLILGILILWMIIVIIISRIEKRGLITVIEDEFCSVNQIGKTESGRNIYSYCLKEVNLEKTLDKNGQILESLLMKYGKKKNCLYDGGTCSYTTKEYQMISCMQNGKNQDIIITTRKQDFEELYHQFCDIEEILK